MRLPLRPLLASALLFASPSHSTEFRNLGEELLFGDIPVVITASKFEESLLDAPSSITVVTQEEIRNSGARTLMDVINMVPGFEMDRAILTATHGTIGARGRLTDSGEDVLFMIDGQRMNDVYLGGGLTYLKDLPVHNITRVELIRGPGSALYGSNAFSGIVNVITEGKRWDRVRSVSLLGGGLGAAGGEALVRQTVGPVKVDASLNGIRDDGDAYRFTRGNLRGPGEIPPVIRDPIKGSYDGGLRLGWGGLFLQADYNRRHLRGYMPEGLIDKPFSTPILDGNTDDSRHLRVQGGFTWDVTDRLRVIPTVRFNEAKLRQVNILATPATASTLFPPFVSATTLGWFGGPEQQARSFEYDLQVNHRGDKNSVVAGLVYARQELTHVANLFNVNPYVQGFPFSGEFDFGSEIRSFEGDSAYADPRGRDILGVYLQDTWKVFEDTTLNAGGRYDNYNDFGHAFSPRMGLVQRLGEGVRAKLLYGRAYRAPTFIERYARNNPVIQGNSGLDAQTIETFEANATVLTARNTLLSFTAYHNLYRNLIQVDNAGVPHNSPDKQKDWGGEAEARLKRDEFKYLSFNYSYISPHDTGGDIRPDIARNKASVAANYDLWPRKLVANVNAFFRGARRNSDPSDPGHLVRDAVVVNAYFRWLNVLPGTELDLGLYNIGDEQWKNPGFPAVTVPDNLPNRGFQWLLKLSHSF